MYKTLPADIIAQTVMASEVFPIVNTSSSEKDLLEFDSITNEGFLTSLTDFLKSSTANILDVVTRIVKNETYISVTLDMSPRDIATMLEKAQFSTLKNYRAYVPSKMKTMHRDHVDILITQLETLHDLENRVLHPVLTFIGKLINDPTVGAKRWAASDIKLIKTEPLKNTLAKTFDLRIDDANLSETTIDNIYASKGDIVKTAKALGELHDVAMTYNLDNILKLEHRVLEMIDDVVEISKEIVFDKKTIKTLAGAIHHASEELEYISALLYYTNANIATFNQTMESIELTLKG